MVITIIKLCIAVYASPTASEPVSVDCRIFDAPVQYDTRQCSGEVITDRWPNPTTATCEITRQPIAGR